MRLQWEGEGTRGELRYDRSLRRTGGRNDTGYLLSVPETARRLRAALEDSITGRNLIEMGSMADLRAAVGLDGEQ